MTPGMYPENLDPSVGLPIAACLFVIYFAQVLNDRRNLRKEENKK